VTGALLTRVVSYITKTFFYVYQLCHATITRTNSVRVFFDSKLHFHNHVDYIFSECIKLLGIIRSITYRFSPVECLYFLYFTLVRSKLKYASVVWSSITSTDANRLEIIQQKLASVWFHHFFLHVPYTYTVALDKSILHSLCKRRHNLDAFLFVQVYRGFKSCTSLLENVSLRVPPSSLRDCSVRLCCQRRG
jgi:hypothetical protein